MGSKRIRVRGIALGLMGVAILSIGAGCSRPDERRVVEKRDAAESEKRVGEEPAIATQEPSEAARSDPAVTDSKTNTNPETPSDREPPVPPEPAEVPSNRPAKPKREPRRPTDDWVIFREAFKPAEDATCETKWVGGNQFEVTTQNVMRVTIDLTRLPPGAPTRGPWIIRMDGQAVELTGFKPRDGYTGLKRDLVRSQNGKWSVDKDKLYRAGT